MSDPKAEQEPVDASIAPLTEPVPTVRPDPATPDEQAFSHHQSTPPPGRLRKAVPPPPGYEILYELGRGGMGVVYRARQIALQRDVALKMLLGADTQATRRFLIEAETLAALHHPHVVSVYAFGDDPGYPFFAMEFLSGGTLAAYLRDQTILKPLDAAGLVRAIAQGVQAAHAQGIIHRDLKPANILFDGNFEPKVTDFGIAKRALTDMTQTGIVMGTPAYMAPEQASGQGKFVGPPADVWALGVILYESITGLRPFRADTSIALMLSVQHDEPIPPRRLQHRLPRDLERICLKCLAKDPADRYATAGDLAMDLQRFRDGEPVSITQAGYVTRAAKWARRKPTTAAAWLFGTLAAIGLGVATLTFQLYRQAEVARTEATNLRDATEQSLLRETIARESEQNLNQQLVQAQYSRMIHLAYRELREGNLTPAQQLLDKAPAEPRSWEWDYIRRLASSLRHTKPS
ncbi:MAG: protein kinase domain-containing protein, partial [Gemmataceae bacterium]